jgi:hypothetical protein
MKGRSPVIPLELARQLTAAGLPWKPAMGDRFAIPDRDMDDEVFVLSNMTIEVQELPDGPVIGFNGTTEWALDDVEKGEAIWLPSEEQLRVLLGGTFRALARAGDRYRVDIELLGTAAGFDGDDPAEAYARALLHLLEAAGAAEASPGPPPPARR